MAPGFRIDNAYSVKLSLPHLEPLEHGRDLFQ
jgi:hypothetical protein